ncbi:MAG: hypothetical protein H0W64_07370 [Gammaproteobacteria bacterium]|nr:hypothetical protein [Gammaproteobacteria bacterium]
MNDPFFRRLHSPALLAAAKKLPATGTLAKTHNGLIYLNINDDFVHTLFPLITKTEEPISKPDYFGKGLIGAHISVIYPDELKLHHLVELNHTFSFQVCELFKAPLGTKNYYALRVNSKPLTTFRNKYDLPNWLLFKAKWVPFHITLAVSPLS